MRKSQIIKVFCSLALSAAFLLPALSGCGSKADEPQKKAASSISFVNTVSEGSWGAATANKFSLTTETSDGYNLITWSAAWANASSTWASGKAVSDYMTVTPDTDDARNATAECLQEYKEPIIVTATRQDNWEYAIAQCDYVARCVSSTTFPTVGRFGTVALVNGNPKATAKNFVIDGASPFYFFYYLNSTSTVKGYPRIDSILYATTWRQFFTQLKSSAYFAQAQSLYNGTIAVNANGGKLLVTIDNYAYVGKVMEGGTLQERHYMSCTFTHSIGDFFTFSGEDYETLKTTNPECVKYLQWAVYEKLSAFASSTTICDLTVCFSYEYNGVTVHDSTSVKLSNTGLLDLSNLSTPPAA